MIHAQNEAFLQAAANGAALPKYQWPPQGAPNCPPPADPAREHQESLERAIQTQVRLLQQGKSTAGRDEAVNLMRQLEVGVRFGNDITRLPAYTKYAALCRFMEGKNQ